MDKSSKLFDFNCSSCGASGKVPFQPRPGSALKCRACFGKDKAVGGRSEGRTSDNRRDERADKRSGPRREGGPARGQGDERGRARGEGGSREDRGPRGEGGRPGNDRGPRREGGGRQDEGGRPGPGRGEGRPGGSGGRRGPQNKIYEISCVECGSKDFVPFEPRAGSNVLCSKCHGTAREERDRRQSYFDKGREGRSSANSVHIPRIDHGTRVSFPIQCDQCAKREVLDYMPRTSGPVLCTACTEKKFGSTWFQAKQAAERAKELKRAERERNQIARQQAENPERAIHQPTPERLEDFEAINDLVKVRRS